MPQIAHLPDGRLPLGSSSKGEAPLLRLHNLHVSFETPTGDVVAVQDVSLEVGKGEVVGIVGESGSGKTVTSLSIMRLLGSNAKVTGEVRFRGKDVLQATRAELRNIRGAEIALISQNAMEAFNPVMTIGQQLGEAIRAHRPTSRRGVLDRSVELLEHTGITEPERRLDQYPHEFSGGMLQRAMIAMALSGDPDLVIADEPTTALDVTVQSQILLLLDRLRRESGLSLLLVTHDLGLLAGMADRVHVMYAGKVVETGRTEDIFYSSRHPYTIGLLRSAPKLIDEREGIEPIPGTPASAHQIVDGCSFQPRCSLAQEKCTVLVPALERVTEHQLSACWYKHSIPVNS